MKMSFKVRVRTYESNLFGNFKENIIYIEDDLSLLMKHFHVKYLLSNASKKIDYIIDVYALINKKHIVKGFYSSDEPGISWSTPGHSKANLEDTIAKCQKTASLLLKLMDENVENIGIGRLYETKDLFDAHSDIEAKIYRYKQELRKYSAYFQYAS
ncbi:hypothetical protein [Cysteiniphilum litorale]|uniref:hypothetical protein n=1 Tax=Cysteiniphilum litorale TaxID=2056700 RepID=UPI003F880F0B